MRVVRGGKAILLHESAIPYLRIVAKALQGLDMNKAVSKGSAYLFVFLSSVSGLLAAKWVFHQSFIGLDFQDESFFLNMALHPLEYPEMPTRIGVCLKPLFLIVGENIPRLRQLSFLLLALGLYLNFFFARKVGTFIPPGICERTSMVGLASVVACFSWIARGGTCRSLGYNQQTCVLMLFLSAAVLAWFAGKGKTNLRKWSWPHYFTGLGITWLAGETSSNLFLDSVLCHIPYPQDSSSAVGIWVCFLWGHSQSYYPTSFFVKVRGIYGLV